MHIPPLAEIGNTFDDLLHIHAAKIMTCESRFMGTKQSHREA